ncbi:MAG: hypothetical protein KGJ30_09780 [Burkholderiales bacterium]|nr:hypothetical protein [Burkholderiales bacterium]MDE2159201.1 hypothetical protein [Burkholderiales bacterium]
MAAGLAQAQGAASGADDAAAMERARRAAESPFKAILEASKFRRKPGAESGAEAPPTPSEPVLRRLGASARGAPTSPALSAMPIDEPRVGLVLQPLPPGPDPKWVATLAPPKLVHMVEPVIPPRLLADIDSVRRYTVTMRIERDGSVTDVRIEPAPPRGMLRYIVDALEQWRYAPQPLERRHRVLLEFKPG